MRLIDELKSVTRIEIEPPERTDESLEEGRRVVIDSEPAIRDIISALQFDVSNRRAIQACKVPPGFRVWFVTKKGSLEADVTISGHKHLIMKVGNEGETVHYELPPRFEKVMQPYFRKSLGFDEF